MTWLQRYRVRHYLGSSIWIFPVLSTLAAIGAVRVLHWIELDAGWVSPVDPETARGVLGTMASALFTAIVFICSALLVAVQLAGAQLTPRVIGIEEIREEIRCQFIILARKGEPTPDYASLTPDYASYCQTGPSCVPFFVPSTKSGGRRQY